MAQLRETLLKRIGAAGIVLALVVAPLNALHPVLSAGAAWLAIILGGIAGLGRGFNLVLGLATIVLALGSVFLVAAYAAGDGFQLPTQSNLSQIIFFYAVPLFAAVVLIIIGRSKRWNSAP